MGSEVADKLAIDYFIDAIPESDIRLRLKEATLNSMTEAENLAVKLEALRMADKHRGKPVRTVECSNSADNSNEVFEQPKPQYFNRQNRNNHGRRNNTNYRPRQNYGTRNGNYTFPKNEIYQNQNRQSNFGKSENYQALGSGTGTQH